MGTGSRTRESAAKRPRQYSTDSAEVAAAGAQGGADYAESVNQCLVSFDVEVSDITGSLKVGDKLALTFSSTGGLQITHQGRRVAAYDQADEATLKRCIKKKFIYIGIVQAVGPANSVSCSFEGMGPV